MSVFSKRPVLLCAISETEKADFLPEPLWSNLSKAPVDFHYLSLPPAGAGTNELVKALDETGAEILLTAWSTPSLPEDLSVGEPGSLCYLCHLAGSVRDLVPRRLMDRGLRVTNWGDTISRTVAECALMLMLSALRRSSAWALDMHMRGAWKNKETLENESLFERRVGLHGFGSISRELVKLLAPFHTEIETYSPSVGDELLQDLGVKRARELKNLFENNDVIVELAAATPATYHMVDEAMLRLIKPGGVFVNVGRGSVVDEEALASIAVEGNIQVALDVYEQEPLPTHSPLRGMPNVTLVPHIGGPTRDRRRDSGKLACRNLDHYLNHRSLEAEITPEIYDRST